MEWKKGEQVKFHFLEQVEWLLLVGCCPNEDWRVNAEILVLPSDHH